MEAILGLCYMITLSGNLFGNNDDAREPAKIRASLIFQERFPDFVSSQGSRNIAST